MTHGDRVGDPPGRRETAGDAGHPASAAPAPLLRRTGRQGLPTPPAVRPRDRRRLPQVLWAKAFGRPNACGRGTRLAMPRIATPCAPGRKPWEAVSMGRYQRSLVLGPVLQEHL